MYAPSSDIRGAAKDAAPPKDETDVAAVPPLLGWQRRQWLSDALAQAYGQHLWLDHLQQ